MTVSNPEMMGWHVAVAIPARDEEKLLPRCLRSVITACMALPAEVSTDIIVVSDCSSDGTLRIAKTMLEGSGAVFESFAGNVGVARALASRQALARYATHGYADLTRCWLANTDADCEVPENWLVHQLGVARRGSQAVAGVVGVDSFAEHLPVVESRFRATYVIHPDGSHPHIHGANLGVRADAYLQAGGWNALPTAEDHDLWSRLKACDIPRVRDAHLRVTTSGRRVGRAPLGFAGALAAHNHAALKDAAA